MVIEKLTAQLARLAYCPEDKTRVNIYDEGGTGFMLEVRRNGSTWYQRVRDPSGRLRQIKVATNGAITFEQAKKAAQKIRSEALLGGDPAGQREKQRAIPLYADLAEQHLAHAKTYQRSYDSTERIINNHVLPRWGKKRLDEIKQQDVAKWLADKRAGGLAPASVEKIRTMFSRSFVLAKQWDIYDRNPVKDVPRLKFNNARTRYLNAEEAKVLIMASDCSSNKQLKPFILLALFTGARRSELLNAEWRHIDLEKRSWHLPMTKNGKSRHVPLAKAAVEIIQQLPKYDGCPYLLANPRTKLPYVDIKKAFQKARKLAGLEDIFIHSLRHTAASWYIANGVDI